MICSSFIYYGGSQFIVCVVLLIWVVFSFGLLGIAMIVELLKILLYLRTDPKSKKPSVPRRNVV